MKLDIFTSSLVLVLPINVFFCDFTAFFAADFLAAGVFAAAEDILSNKKGCWQGYGFFLKKYLFPMLLKKIFDFGVGKQTLVLSEKKILNETKNHTHPPWSVPKRLSTLSAKSVLLFDRSDLLATGR
jgi:hypothetical protein